MQKIKRNNVSNLGNIFLVKVININRLLKHKYHRNESQAHRISWEVNRRNRPELAPTSPPVSHFKNNRVTHQSDSLIQGYAPKSDKTNYQNFMTNFITFRKKKGALLWHISKIRARPEIYLVDCCVNFINNVCKLPYLNF